MLEWTSVYWLATAFAAGPVIWWLHRLRRPTSQIRVSALFLWAKDGADEQPGVRPRAADSTWRLRALIAVCLCLAAAGPMWFSGAGRPIEVWLDDSLSMKAREVDGLRYEKVIDSLMDALRDVDVQAVTIHSLGSPGKNLALALPVGEGGRRQLLEWFQGPSLAPILPSSVSMTPHVEHWLVTDGATEGFEPWLKETPIHKIIKAGDATENAGLMNFSLRRSLRDPNLIIGFASVQNFGDQVTDRELVVRSGDRILSRAKLTVPPGAIVSRSFQFKAPGSLRLEAQIIPTDAVSDDDAFALEYDKIARVPIQIRGGCGHALRTAIGAHPGVHLVDNTDIVTTVAFTVVCGRKRPSGFDPVIWVRWSDDIVMLHRAPYWSSSAGPLQDVIFDAAWLRQVKVSKNSSTLKPLLTVGSQPLILMSDTPQRLLEVRLDLSHSGLTRRPEFPVLIAGLIDLTLGYSPLEAYAGGKRPSAASVIKPRNLDASKVSRTKYQGEQRWELAAYFVAAALVLLMLDTMLYVIRWRRGHPARPGPH